ncbi:myosin-10-like isoform X2 [Halichondria panicea]|uniref:myosin-10-like isoform X2 n=1 Tax=Halichondria panicea TaxID=6063 RepID=UPI00312B80A8
MSEWWYLCGADTPWVGIQEVLVYIGRNFVKQREAVLKEGYLVKAPDVSKYVHNFKKWQRKWFQLNTSGDLYFYDNDKTSKPTGVIHLLQCTRLFDAKSRGLQTSYCCGIDTGDLTFYVKAESAKSYREWIKPMSEFADVCEVDIEALDERRGTLTTGERRGTLPDDGRRGTLSEEGRHGTLLSDRDRAESVQSRHLSISALTKFLTKEGWLAKTGSNNKGWKDRYFRLKNGKLYYYKDSKTDSSLSDIDLFNSTSIENAPGKKGHGIDIHMPGRVYNLSAENKDDCDDWTAVLSHTLTLIADIRDPSTSSVPRTGSNTSIQSATSTSDRDTATTTTPVSERKYVQATGGSSGREEDKDSVVQLLEAEVEALRDKLASLQSDLKANSAHNKQLQQKLLEVKRSHSSREKELLDENEQLSAQVSRLEKSKRELETVNDSVQTQLEEQLDKVQELEEELLVTRQDLEDAQTNNATIEEDLSETQQRLQEIEQVAHDLEASLRKKESEPATPISTSFKGLPSLLENPLGDKARVTVEEAALRLEGESQQSSESTNELKQELSQLAKDKDDLLEQVKILQASLALAESKQPAINQENDSSKVLEEERLKWQMEMENMRRELNDGLNGEREVWVLEKRGLENTVDELRKRLVSQDRVAELEGQLSQSQTRVTELESEVESGRERLSQLQVQNKKAVTDLIAIRKTNKSMEKRMSESEDTRVPSPMNSLSPVCGPDTPEVVGRVTELEQQLEQLNTTLTDVQNERDILMTKVDRLTSGIQSTPDFGFKFKAGASVVGSNITSSGHSVPSLSNGSTPHSDNVSETSNPDAPPPKPKRPPKDLISKLTQNKQVEEVPLETKIRTRTASFLKSIKTMMM